MGVWEVSIQNGSVLFKTGELEHMTKLPTYTKL